MLTSLTTATHQNSRFGHPASQRLIVRNATSTPLATWGGNVSRKGTTKPVMFGADPKSVTLGFLGLSAIGGALATFIRHLISESKQIQAERKDLLTQLATGIRNRINDQQ